MDGRRSSSSSRDETLLAKYRWNMKAGENALGIVVLCTLIGNSLAVTCYKTMFKMSTVEDQLKTRWRDLLTPDYKPNPTLSTFREAWWVRVQNHYSEGARHYHTLDHIHSMFGLFDEFRGKLKSPEIVEWAIFFHDVIYDPKAKDNEEMSAKLFEVFASECLPSSCEETIQQVQELILLTRLHITDAHKSPKMFGSSDEHYFLDFDMQVLGWNPTDYDCYAQQVRQEYIHIPEGQYKRARAQILKDFLKTPNIYATKEFRDRYEVQARANIRREIERLEAGQEK